jgi:HAD superfamily hydrolase (TIGR01509 family)
MAGRLCPRHVGRMVSAVIFDVDGTLVDTVDFHATAWQRAFRHFGREIPFDRVRHEIGKGADQLMPVFLTPEELRRFGAELAAYRTELYERDFLPRVRAFPEVRELLERIARDGRRIVLASSAKRSELDTCIDRASVGDLISGAVSGDDADRSKPHPDVFEAALDRLGSVDPREVIIVGDTPYDAEAAAKLGITTVGVLSGGFPEMDLVEAGCVAVYRDPADLLARYDESPLASPWQSVAAQADGGDRVADPSAEEPAGAAVRGPGSSQHARGA